jgi:cell division initiation protein
MSLTPIDIQEASFEKRMRGYDPEQVRALLQRAAETLEGTLKQLQAARDELEAIRADEAQARQREDELRRALVAAEAIGEQVKENAKREAKLIVEGAHSKRRQVLGDVERLKLLRDDMKTQFEAMLDGYRASLQVNHASPAEDDGPLQQPLSGVDEDDASLADAIADPDGLPDEDGR